MMPPAGAASASANGRAYATRPGVAIDVLAQDVSAMLGKGWTRDPLTAAIERGADYVASVRIVAAELVAARRMREALVAQDTKNHFLSLPGVMKGLRSEMSREAEALAARIRNLHERGMEIIQRGHKQVASEESAAAEMEAFVKEMEAIGDNNGPSLIDAAKSSG
jgi:hypothetical protein